jgi:predicted  nucleic acid-binding Zn-ribbon protein
VQALKAEASRSENVILELRVEIKRVRDYVHGLELTLPVARARTDAARAQADSALSTSREFLANLLAAREEQHRQLGENGVAFADLRRKAADLDSRLRAQQQLIERRNVAFNEATRRLIAVEAEFQDAGRRSMQLEAQAKVRRETDNGLSKQLVTLSKQVDETRSLISSEGLLQLMRDLEDMRRNAAALRGSIDELQMAQSDSSMQAKNSYLDLDARIQTLNQAQADLALQDRNAHLDEERLRGKAGVQIFPLNS